MGFGSSADPAILWSPKARKAAPSAASVSEASSAGTPRAAHCYGMQRPRSIPEAEARPRRVPRRTVKATFRPRAARGMARPGASKQYVRAEWHSSINLARMGVAFGGSRAEMGVPCCGEHRESDGASRWGPGAVDPHRHEAAIAAGRGEIVLSVPTIRCGQCIAVIERALGACDGVAMARVNLTLRRVRITLSRPGADPAAGHPHPRGTRLSGDARRAVGIRRTSPGGRRLRHSCGRSRWPASAA